MAALPLILQALERKRYTIFKGRNYDLNIVGIRSKFSHDTPWSDNLAVVYKKGFIWHVEWFDLISRPTSKWLLDPVNLKGAAILKTGQYFGAYKLGLHRGRPALIQTGREVTVHRDNDRDMLPEETCTLDTGYFGINFHDPKGPIESASAGCQILRGFHMDRLLELCRLQEQYTSYTTFTYTLINEEDLCTKA